MRTKNLSRRKAPNKQTVVAQSLAAATLTIQADGKKKALRCAVYLRYSTDEQKETSIDDQLRCCEEEAARHGFTITESLVFADDAITGSAKGTHKREQYHAMRMAVCAGAIDVIICDQQCRLARNAKEALTFFDELKMHGVRLLTADGFDSEHVTAQLLFGIKSVFAEFFLDETRHRVHRGMVGEFDRGTMVTAVPYGFQVDVVGSAAAGRCVWVQNPEQAEVVKEIFRCRADGMSLNQVTGVLNGRGVPTPHEGKRKSGLYWRSGAIWRILQSPIYKGLYVVNFGGDKAEEHSLRQRLMPELAIVSAEAWDKCQSQGKGSPARSAQKAAGGTKSGGLRGTYGGGKHPLAGVIRCGVCGVTLSAHHGATDKGSMHCIQCDHATAVGIPGRQPRYVSIQGVRQMIRWLLEKMLTEEALHRYRECLHERLAGGREGELATARQALQKAEQAQVRLSRLLSQITSDDPVLEQQYVKQREEALHLTQLIRDIEQGMRELNQGAIQKQLDLDLSVVVDAFLSDKNAPERTRALLNRIFPSIVLVEKLHRYTAIFKFEVKPGAILAEATNTVELVNGNEVVWVRLQTSGSKNAVWTVTEISADYGAEDQVAEPLAA
jgi:DNA invertase Pin-like site-specific DNA recombinase